MAENTPIYTPPRLSELRRPEGSAAGTWGEQLGPQPVSVSRGVHDFEKVAGSSPTVKSKTPKIAEKPFNPPPVGERGSFGEPSTESPETLNEAEKEAEGSFDLREWLEARDEQEKEKNLQKKSLAVAWRDLRVAAPQGKAAIFIKTLPQAVLGTFGPDLYHILNGLVSKVVKPRVPNLDNMKDILTGHTGILLPNEMLLVLGRPGSGCTTFLQAVTSSLPDSLVLDPNSKISYSGFGPDIITRKLRGEVVYSGEDDLHYPSRECVDSPTLKATEIVRQVSVEDTLRFALENKVPSSKRRLESRKDFINTAVDLLLKIFGITHVKRTRVGDAYSRGVSGGERKRVTIAEALITRGTVIAWDNSTRGLDASTALDYARSLQLLTKLRRTSATIATLYQVSETIYECFDRVLLMDEGRTVYYGPRDKAREYFGALGYYSSPRQTTADFLTSITDPNEVRYKEGFESKAPRTSLERERAWKESKWYEHLLKEIDDYDDRLQHQDTDVAEKTKQIVRQDKHRGVSKGSNFTVPFHHQVIACAKRQILIKWGERENLYIKLFTIVSISLLISSLFFITPSDTSGAYAKGGIILFACLFNSWMQLAESIEAVQGRIIIQKHKTFGFHRPSAMVLARALTDIPLLAVQCFISSIVIYFMAHLRVDAGGFFIFYLFVFLSAYSFTALYRLLAAFSPGFNEAIRFAVLALNVIVVFIGYVIHRPQMNWMRFLSYINPTSYVFETLLVNEFTYDIPCNPQQIIPFNEQRDIQYQSCNLAGNRPGSLFVSGPDYLATAFNYSRDNIWRNFGVAIAFTVLYMIPTVLATEYLPFAGDGGGSTVLAPTKKAKKLAQELERAQDDPEKAAVKDAVGPAESNETSSNGSTVNHTPNVDSNGKTNNFDDKPVFTWTDVNYYTAGKRLLHDVTGYVKPGRMTALMGASGAGKTTLLTTLAQRQTSGDVQGVILVDGKPLSAGFQKGTGFALQGDVHLPTQTVREAIEFSAFLRQPREVSDEEKTAEVEHIIDLLELRDLEDAVIGVPGAGLGVERRKRVTIAVELAAKPDVLLFLDEPTSGLDSAGASSIIRLVRKLAEDGQAILCTIHQPSALLFESFDDLCLLKEGGEVTYFGQIGEQRGHDSKLVRDYFQKHGAPQCPADANVAEYILELTAGDRTGKIDWGKRWRDSIEAQSVRQHVDELVSERAKRPDVQDYRAHREFSSSLYTQIAWTTRRLFIDMYRDAAYPYGVMFSHTVVGLVLGLAFQHIGYGVIDFQNRVFLAFIIITNFPAIVNAIVSKSFMVRSIYEAREGPSKTYSWIALITSFILTALPMGAVSAVLYFLPSFFIPNYTRTTEVAGFVFLMTLLFVWFAMLFAFALTSASPTPTAAANILPFLLSIMAIVNGIFVPHMQMPNPWKDFVYYVNPVTYYVSAFLGVTLHGLEVQCKDVDLVTFNPPSGQSCQSYAGSWLSENVGYFVDPNATTSCQYCPFNNGDQYLQMLDVRYDQRWRNFGIFLAYTVFNAFLAYLSYYLFRVRGLSWPNPLGWFKRSSKTN